MSSALAIALMAMAVPANGPEMVSEEMEQRLDLRGKWEGMWWVHSERRVSCRLENQEMTTQDGIVFRTVLFPIADMGDGRLSVFHDHFWWHGIYRQDRHQLLICIRQPDEGFPDSFEANEMQQLLILHRVKPRK